VAPAIVKDVLVPAPHPPEFRRRAVELARQRTKPVAELAKELRISESCLRNWMAQADVDDAGGSDAQLTSKEKKELAKLRRDKRRLETEIEILKRAAGTSLVRTFSRTSVDRYIVLYAAAHVTSLISVA
jgi:transposase